MRDELLDYYERELIFIRRMGADFARKYPKVAARLLIDEEKIEDPHVERMIEAFAFLAGRINLKLDDELPEITESFLNVIYPHYLSPIPSMAISQFLLGSPKNKMTAIQKIAREAKLYSRPIDGSPCNFKTCYDTQLVPVEVSLRRFGICRSAERAGKTHRLPDSHQPEMLRRYDVFRTEGY